MADTKVNEEKSNLDTRENALGSIIHKGIPEVLNMNKWHFLLTIERLQKQSKGVQWEHPTIPFGIFLAILLSMVSADFKFSLGLKAEVWESVAFCLLIASAIATVILFIMWMGNQKNTSKKSPEEILNDVIEEMDEECKKLEDLDKKRQGIK